MKIRQIVLGFTAGLLILLALPLSIVAGNSSDGSFTIALVISNISVSNVGLTEADVSWDTNNNATSQVYYDTKPHDNIESYRYRTAVDPAAVLNHSVHLAGLLEGTTYHCRIRSVAMSGPYEHVAVSDNFRFTTARFTTTATTTTSATTTTTSGTTTETTTVITTTQTSSVTTTSATATTTSGTTTETTTVITTTRTSSVTTTPATTTAGGTTTAATSPVITDTTTSPVITDTTTSPVTTDTTTATTTPFREIMNMPVFYWIAGTVLVIGLSWILLLLFMRRRKKKEEE